MKVRENKEKKTAHSATIWVTGSLLFDSLENQDYINFVRKWKGIPTIKSSRISLRGLR